jgi:hypothetical protein
VLTSYGADAILSIIGSTSSSIISVSKHMMSMDQLYVIQVKDKLNNLDLEAKIYVLTDLNKDLTKDKEKQYMYNQQ